MITDLILCYFQTVINEYIFIYIFTYMVIPFTGMIYDNEEGKKNSPQYLHRNRARWTGHNNTLSSDHMCNSPLHFEAWRTAAAESVAQ